MRIQADREKQIEELKKKKKQIEETIKLLQKSNGCKFGKSSFMHDYYDYAKRIPCFKICIEAYSEFADRKCRTIPIVTAGNFEEVVTYLEETINDLQSLHHRLKQEEAL